MASKDEDRRRPIFRFNPKTGEVESDFDAFLAAAFPDERVRDQFGTGFDDPAISYDATEFIRSVGFDPDTNTESMDDLEYVDAPDFWEPQLADGAMVPPPVVAMTGCVSPDGGVTVSTWAGYLQSGRNSWRTTVDIAHVGTPQHDVVLYMYGEAVRGRWIFLGGLEDHEECRSWFLNCERAGMTGEVPWGVRGRVDLPVLGSMP